MNTVQSVALAVSLALLFPAFGVEEAIAARKYYPPGFTPPPDNTQVTPPKVIVQPVPGEKQVIIKTVPVIRQAPPKDPLTALLDERRYFEALRMVEARLKKAPANVSLQLLRAQILRDQKNYDEAVDQYESILDRQRGSSVRASALNGLGWTHYQHARQAQNAGDTEGYDTYRKAAETAFRQAIRLSPRYVYPMAGLGQMALDDGDLSKARELIQRAARLSPQALEVKLAQAELLLAEGKAEEALNRLYPLKKTHSRHPGVYLLLAKASLAEDRVDDGIINLKQLLEIVPEHTEALKLLSTAYERKMKPEDARQSLEKAVALNPADESSVEALLRIYDQGYEAERAILLLKTLLKERPDQRRYQLALLERLAGAGRWNELYETGRVYAESALGQRLADTDPTAAALVNYFAEASYHHSKGLINRTEFLDEPAIRQVQEYSRRHLDKKDTLAHRLNLLLIDPLANLPPISGDQLLAAEGKELERAIKIAYLQGDWPLHQRLLAQWQLTSPPLTEFAASRNAMALAANLLDMGDYLGAETITQAVLTSNHELADAQDLLQDIQQTRQAARDQLTSLEMLPKRIPEAYWQKTASETLRLGATNWKAHALLAERLEDEKSLALALVHQRLAARYAPDEKERRRWEKKADKTQRRLGNRRG